MPADRDRAYTASPARRRRSSLALEPLKSIRPGTYNRPSPTQPVTFAPNVTPISYTAPSDSSDSESPEDSSLVPIPVNARFLPSSTPFLPHNPTTKRPREKRRRRSSHIPRPPNAFMLFRADFVKAKHVPGSIEANHGTLSKIIGTCWKSLPIEERRVWEVKAKEAKAYHKKMYPDYRFRPVHNKNKKAGGGDDSREFGSAAACTSAKKQRTRPSEEEERRSEGVAQLLLQGLKGEELARSVRKFDIELEQEREERERRVLERAEREGQQQQQQEEQEQERGRQLFLHQQPQFPIHRRSSSVPLPFSFNPSFSPNFNFGAANAGFQPSFAPMPYANDGEVMALPSVPTVPYLPPPPASGGSTSGAPNNNNNGFAPSFFMNGGESRANSFSRQSRRNSMLWLGSFPSSSYQPHQSQNQSQVQGQGMGQGQGQKRRRRSSSLPRGFGGHEFHFGEYGYSGYAQQEQQQPDYSSYSYGLGVNVNMGLMPDTYSMMEMEGVEESSSLDDSLGGSLQMPEVESSLWNPGFEFGADEEVGAGAGGLGLGLDFSSFNSNNNNNSNGAGEDGEQGPYSASTVESDGEKELVTPTDVGRAYDFSSMFQSIAPPSSTSASANPFAEVSPLDPNPNPQWLDVPQYQACGSGSGSESASHPGSSYSTTGSEGCSPALSDASLPGPAAGMLLVAPKPQYATPPLGSPVALEMQMHAGGEQHGEVGIKSSHSSPEFDAVFFGTPMVSPLEGGFPAHVQSLPPQHREIQL